jgi:hypothetical protein
MVLETSRRGAKSWKRLVELLDGTPNALRFSGLR